MSDQPAARPHSLTVRGEALANAPMERLWALSSRIELVQKTLGMRPVAGVTEGSVQGGSRVVWRGWKFGLPTEHHTLITGWAEPHPAAVDPDHTLELHAEGAGQPVAWFQDSQERGRFAFFEHNHWFRQRFGPTGEPFTVLEDEVHFRLPFGVAGRLVARWVMAGYIRRLIHRRFATLRQLAEGEGWRTWVS